MQLLGVLMADSVRRMEGKMKKSFSRREFVKAGIAAACGTAASGSVAKAEAASVSGASGGALPASPEPDAPLPIKKAVLLSMLPKQLSYKARFAMARRAGFDAVEAYTIPDQQEVKLVKRAADDAGVRIHSVMNMGHWEWPLSSSDPAVVKRSLAAMRISLGNAKFWGAETVLLVPAVVTPEVNYSEAWKRSQEQIHTLLPLAQQLGVKIAVEEVWNKFLLSPLEFPRYVDQFKSPWLKSYFDVGNVVLYGYPEEWIRQLGPRIAKLHLKDFDRKTFKFVNLGEGSVDWPAVRAALRAINYHGYATVELEDGDEAYLTDVSKRVDKLVLGKA